MLTNYNEIKETALWFASFEPFTVYGLNQMLKQSHGFQVNEASDVLDHVLLAKRIKLDKVLRYEMFRFFWYKLQSLGVERHITKSRH